MNCDRIAPVYEFLEKAAFGGKLQRHRVMYLDAARDKRSALVLGDGDGRFTEVLATKYPELEIDSIEVSARMVSKTRRRLCSRGRVRLEQGDVFRVSLAKERYDIVFTHFFLDCFETCELTAMVTLVSEALAPNAVWIISDFREQKNGWRKLYTRFSLATMYLFFRFATGLKTRQLPRYDSVLAGAGFTRCGERVSMGGLIASEMWRL